MAPRNFQLVAAADLRSVRVQWNPPEDTSSLGVRGCLEAYVVEWWRATDVDVREARGKSQTFRTRGCDEISAVASTSNMQPQSQAAQITGSNSSGSGSGVGLEKSSIIINTLTELPGMTTVTIVVRVRNRKFIGPDSNQITLFTPEGGTLFKFIQYLKLI